MQYESRVDSYSRPIVVYERHGWDQDRTVRVHSGRHAEATPRHVFNPSAEYTAPNFDEHHSFGEYELDHELQSPQEPFTGENESDVLSLNFLDLSVPSRDLLALSGLLGPTQRGLEAQSPSPRPCGRRWQGSRICLTRN